MRLTGINLGLLLVSLVLAWPAQSAMRCDRSWIDVGASVYEVLSKCGDPSFQQVVNEPVIGVSNAHIQTTQFDNQQQTIEASSDLWLEEPRYRVIERWTYNPGSGRLLQELDFYSGEVIRMRTGSRAP